MTMSLALAAAQAAQLAAAAAPQAGPACVRASADGTVVFSLQSADASLCAPSPGANVSHLKYTGRACGPRHGQILWTAVANCDPRASCPTAAAWSRTGSAADIPAYFGTGCGVAPTSVPGLPTAVCAGSRLQGEESDDAWHREHADRGASGALLAPVSAAVPAPRRGSAAAAGGIKPITGTFLDLQYDGRLATVNSVAFRLTCTQWAGKVTEFANLGIEFIVFQAVHDDRYGAFYNSSLVCCRTNTILHSVLTRGRRR
eukprot:SAG22_NODE_43_length_25304_cov_5.394644_5_plen_258_part_00